MTIFFFFLHNLEDGNLKQSHLLIFLDSNHFFAHWPKNRENDDGSFDTLICTDLIDFKHENCLLSARNFKEILVALCCRVLSPSSLKMLSNYSKEVSSVIMKRTKGRLWIKKNQINSCRHYAMWRNKLLVFSLSYKKPQPTAQSSSMRFQCFLGS